MPELAAILLFGRADMDRLIRDLRHAVRMLLKTPVFTSVVVFTLAVGIGANTAMFSIVNGVLLQGLPFKHADRIVDLNEVERRDIGGGGAIAPATFFDWRKMATSYDVMAVFAPRTYNVTPGHGRAGAAARDDGVDDVLRRAGRVAAPRPHVHEGGCGAGPRSKHRAQLRLLAAAVRRPRRTSSIKRCGSTASPTPSSA